MHATIQKPIAEICSFIGRTERVFVIGCDNCAAKCRSGGVPETKAMAECLADRGVNVVGWCVPGPAGASLCKLSNTRKVLQTEHASMLQGVDSFLVLACGQGVHTMIDATNGASVHAGCDTIFGGETISDERINEYCSLCGECMLEFTGGLCPMTLCSKKLVNGPCGGASHGKCEVGGDRDCGWHLIYERLKSMGKLHLMKEYRPPKNRAKWSSPRSLVLSKKRAVFMSLAGDVSIPMQDSEDAECESNE